MTNRLKRAHAGAFFLSWWDLSLAEIAVKQAYSSRSQKHLAIEPAHTCASEIRLLRHRRTVVRDRKVGQGRSSSPLPRWNDGMPTAHKGTRAGVTDGQRPHALL